MVRGTSVSRVEGSRLLGRWCGRVMRYEEDGRTKSEERRCLQAMIGIEDEG